MSKIDLTQDIETYLICAERYACGRKTYIPEIVQKTIREHLHDLSYKTLNIMLKDLENPINGYGDDKVDKPGWIKLRTDIDCELAMRDGLRPA